jgi:metal-responsive CopG/Arc/MetJ family transcriptional regulator
MSTRVHILVSEELLAQLDRARGDVSRSRFVQRALERYLGLEPEPQFEGERQAVRRAVESGVVDVRVEAGSSRMSANPSEMYRETLEHVRGNPPGPNPYFRRGSSPALARQAELNKAKGL